LGQAKPGHENNENRFAQHGWILSHSHGSAQRRRGQQGFRDNGTKATRFYKPDDGDDQMNEKDEDVMHAGIVPKSQKIPEFRPIL
jgi:hypothetical protein